MKDGRRILNKDYTMGSSKVKSLHGIHTHLVYPIPDQTKEIADCSCSDDMI